MPDISGAMVLDKTRALKESGALQVVSADCGCLMNINGSLEKQRESCAASIWRASSGNAPEVPMNAEQRIPAIQIENAGDPDFRARARKSLKDDQLRRNFRTAMDSLMTKRAAAFSDADERERLREMGNHIRARALSKLPELLERLEANLTRNGVKVHWAETVEEANNIVLAIAQARRAKQVIKGKSMVSEEMEMNHFLEGHGIESTESDMGEYIVQLDHEKPSHIIMPAIHKNAGGRLAVP